MIIILFAICIRYIQVLELFRIKQEFQYFYLKLKFNQILLNIQHVYDLQFA
jgi:hypothetical protein